VGALVRVVPFDVPQLPLVAMGVTELDVPEPPQLERRNDVARTQAIANTPLRKVRTPHLSKLASETWENY
jgi:hypothetical protein